MINALEVKTLTSHVGKFTLMDVNLNLQEGTIMGLIGRNGAGKTTFIRTILNIIPRVNGEVLFNGVPLFGNEETVKAKIGVVFDTPIYPASCSLATIKKIIAPFYQSFDTKKYNLLINRFDLDPAKKLGALSKGMQMKFSIIMALCHDPDLVILDEPAAGLDPAARAEVLDLFLELMQCENKSILFSTHITSDLEKIADYLTIIDQGKIVISQGKDEILDRYALVQADKETITPTLRRELMGIKETALGCSGIAVRERFAGLPGVKMTRPTIEDLLIHLRDGGPCQC